MTLQTTRTTITQVDFRRVAGQSSSRKPILVIGPAATASALAVNTAKKCTSPQDVVDFCNHGPLVEAACHSLALENRTAMIMRTAATGTVAAYVSITSDFADDDPPVVAGDSVVLPEDDLEPGVEFVAGGTLGTSGITYRYRTGGALSAGLSGTLALGIATSITLPHGAGKYILNPPTDALVAIATEMRTNRLAHYANASVHNSADATAAAIITAGAPTTNALALAMINMIRLADISHYANDTAHDSKDYINAITLGAAATLQEARLLAIHLQAVSNAHNIVTHAADTVALKTATATSTGILSYSDTSGLLAGGIASLDAAPGKITFTTAGVTPSDAPPTGAIAGINADTDEADVETVNVSQTAATVSSVKNWYGTGTSVTYAVGQGTGATVAIGTGARMHNSADLANETTADEPLSGVITAGDSFTAETSAPRWSVAELGAALDVVKNLPASLDYDGILLCGPVLTGVEADAIASKVEVLRIKARWRRLSPHFRMRNTDESLSAYATAYEAAFGATTQRTLYGPAVSWYVGSSHPNRFGQVDVRPFSFAFMARLCVVREDINPTDESNPPVGYGSFTGYVRDPLNPSSVLPRAVDDDYSELFTPLRAVAPQTKRQVAETQIYVGQGATLAPDGSDFYVAPYARIIDKACNTAFRPLEKRLGRKVKEAPDHTMDPNERKRIEAGITEELSGPMVKSGICRSVRVLLDASALLNTPPPVVVGATISVNVDGYIDEWTVGISLE